MIYGCPAGWPILALASISGSLVSFIIFKYLLTKKAQYLISINDKFKAFSEILKDDTNSLILLILIRLCPLPYSLSNGALAAIPDLKILNFFLASLITSPKLLIHLFIGWKLKELGSEKTTSSRIVDIVSIVITISAASLATYLIYVKMQQKLFEMHSDEYEFVDDNLVFGNFEDDLELGSQENSSYNIELNSNDFDVDNFIIESDDDDRDVRFDNRDDSKIDK
ncbi:unnamed protein product [Candida verbasci]|uniref:Golgi apparatus membrane protein TVP38 n=1 Tax=Candida verbasci TaxID=1227364 RepID=A0A9W4TY80_9ASCO|nr:unnamed protein product [Candida verbasci]